MKYISPNSREAIGAYDPMTQEFFYIEGIASTGSINVNANVSISGSSLPISGATTAIVTAIVDSSGNQISTFGGGTQYTDGASAPTHPIGTIPVFNNAGTIEAVSVANPLPVSATFSGSISTSPTFAQNPGAGSPTPAYGLIDSSFRPQVSIATALPAGTNSIGAITNTAFTANAGTNLNTSLLALESGGNLATIAGTVSSSKVNINISSGSIANTSFIATQSTGSNLHVVVDSGAITTTSSALPSSEVNGQTTGITAGTAVQIASNALVNGVIVQALSTNTSSIYVGTSSVSSSNGFELQPGQATSVAVSNTNAVWIVSATNGDKVCWIGS